MTAQGAVPKPFDMSQFAMNVTSRGPDLADLYGLTGVPLPNTPPYDLHGRLSRDVHLWKLENIGGRVGSSDLAGLISVRTGDKRPFLTADLKSHSLDFPDLGPPSAARERPGRKVASPKQKAVAQVMQAQAAHLPGRHPELPARIRGLDADVSFKADSIRDAPIALRSGSVQVKLDAGLLTAEPLDPRTCRRAGSPARVQPRWPQGPTLSPTWTRGWPTGAWRRLFPVKFRVPRRSPVRAWRPTCNCTGRGLHPSTPWPTPTARWRSWSPGGQISRAWPSSPGVDVVKGLGLLFSKTQATTPIRCGVVHFTGRGGVLLGQFR